MNVTFSSNGRNYTATKRDIFMDNGSKIIFIAEGKHAHPSAKRIEIKIPEWRRIKPQLRQLDYEGYFGRKPLMKGVNIFTVQEEDA